MKVAVNMYSDQLGPRLAQAGVDIAVSDSSHCVKDALDQGAEILHINLDVPSYLIPYAKKRGLKVVLNFDYCAPAEGKSLLTRMSEGLACRYADEVIVTSRVVKERLAEQYDRTEHVHVIYQGVPKDPQISGDKHYFEELGIEEYKFILASFSTDPQYRTNDLALAFEMLVRKHRIPSDVKLVLTGSWESNDKYALTTKLRLRQTGAVLTGPISDEHLACLQSKCVCYIQPALQHGMPVDVLNAMSYGSSLLVSDVPAHRELDLEEESYFPLGNAKQLAVSLEELLSCPPTRYVYDMSKYNWDYITEQVLDIYKTLM